MIKKIITTAVISTALLMGASNMANAFTIYNMGETKAYEYNELLDRHLDKDIQVWAGYDEEGYKGSHQYIKIKIDGGLHTHDLGMYVGSAEYTAWMENLSKTIEWATVARTNSVDHQKDLTKCSNWNNRCSASFSAWSNGQKATMHLSLEDKDNQFYSFDGQIPLDNVYKLKNILEKAVAKTVSLEQEFKNKPKVNKDELFK